MDTQKQSVVDCSQCLGTGRYFKKYFFFSKKKIFFFTQNLKEKQNSDNIRQRLSDLIKLTLGQLKKKDDPKNV